MAARDGDRPASRAELQRALAVNAATKPLNVAVPAAVVVAAVVLGVPWLIAVALVVYAALGATTFLDEGEAERAGGRLREGRRPAALASRSFAPPIRAQLDAAHREQDQIARTIDGADLSFADVREEVAGLVRALEAAARRAQRLYDYLATQDLRAVRRREAELAGDATADTRSAVRAQREQLERLQAMLRDAYGEMEQVVAALRTVHGRLVGLAVTSEASGEAELVGDVRELRERMDVLTEGIDAASG